MTPKWIADLEEARKNSPMLAEAMIETRMPASSALQFWTLKHRSDHPDELGHALPPGVI